MQRIFRKIGYCPTIKTNVSLPIIYVENSPSGKVVYEKGTSDCPYIATGFECSIKCPIHESAEDIIENP